jgi:hypothetical protein
MDGHPSAAPPGKFPFSVFASGAKTLYLDSGRSSLLDRLRGEHDPVELFSGVAGIGEELAARIHDDLGITTLEELETAAHERGKTRNWVVIYFSDGSSEDQRTVITAESGKNKGKRVVAGS